MRDPPAALGAVRHGPDPQERPQRVQREQAYPSGRVDRVRVGMMAGLRDLGRACTELTACVEC
jgi:hypothetical protein